jgi:hypothetical protein
MNRGNTLQRSIVYIVKFCNSVGFIPYLLIGRVGEGKKHVAGNSVLVKGVHKIIQIHYNLKKSTPKGALI